VLVLATGSAPVPTAAARATPSGTAQPSGTRPATGTPRDDPTPRVDIHLQSVDPGIARPGEPVRLVGSVQNTSEVSIHHPTVRVRVGSRGLDTRDAVAGWAEGRDGAALGDVVASTSVGRLLPPGEQLPFSVRIGRTALHPGLNFGTLPLTLEVVPGMPGKDRARPRTSAPVDENEPTTPPEAVGALRSFLPWDASRNYHRLQLSWVVPLTLPDDPALFGEPGSNRLSAWESAIGPGSRIDRLLRGTARAPVTYLLDPVLVSPYVEVAPAPGEPSAPPSESAPESQSASETPGSSESPESSTETPAPTSTEDTTTTTPPAGTGSTDSTGPTDSTDSTDTTDTTGTSDTSGSGDSAPTGSNESTESSPTPEQPTSSTTPPAPPRPEAEVKDLAAELAQRLRGAGPGSAPPHPIWALPTGDPDLPAVLEHNTDLPALSALMQQPVPEGLGTDVRTGVSWPLGARLDHRLVKRMRQAYRVAPDPLAAALTPRGTVVDRSSSTGVAAYQSPQGLPLLAYDERLSAIAAAGNSRGNGGATVQRFLAETMAIYQQQPAVDRSVLVAPPRGFDADPGVLRDLFRQLRQTPWIRSVPAEDLLAEARRAPRMDQPLTRPRHQRGGANDIRTYPRAGRSPLTAKHLGLVQDAERRLDGIAGITEGGRADIVGRPASAGRQLLSTRYRGSRVAWATLAGQVRDATRDLRRAVHVTPSTVNFLADEGALQITIVNNLDADVRNVRLDLEAGSTDLQITQQPGALHIGAHSRTSVRVHVSALGSGDVPIHTQLTTPNGTRLGTHPRVIVHVQPTGSWIYWVVGIVAALILALGLYRSFRGGRGHQGDEGGHGGQGPDENGTRET
jgi:hypothetical protein